MDQYDVRSSSFFHQLPTFLQENVMQSGVPFQNDKELQQFLLNIRRDFQ